MCMLFSPYVGLQMLYQCVVSFRQSGYVPYRYIMHVVHLHRVYNIYVFCVHSVFLVIFFIIKKRNEN